MSEKQQDSLPKQLDELADVVGNLAAWLHTTLGTEATTKILERVTVLRNRIGESCYPEFSHPTPETKAGLP